MSRRQLASSILERRNPRDSAFGRPVLFIPGARRLGAALLARAALGPAAPPTAQAAGGRRLARQARALHHLCHLNSVRPPPPAACLGGERGRGALRSEPAPCERGRPGPGPERRRSRSSPAPRRLPNQAARWRACVLSAIPHLPARAARAAMRKRTAIRHYILPILPTIYKHSYMYIYPH